LEADMAVGRIKFFNAQRGFGFITPDDGTEDVFVHKNAVASAGMNTLSEGQRVSYEVIVVRGKTAASDLSTA
jgi:CspA family cold shock protein